MNIIHYYSKFKISVAAMTLALCFSFQVHEVKATISSDHSSIFMEVEILRFAALKTGNKVEILWLTKTETENAQFVIERSRNGVDFYTIMTVAGAGNSVAPIFYEEADYDPYAGTNYYRLKMIDNNGGITYSETALVTFMEQNQATLSVAPNPAPPGVPLTLRLDGAQKERALIELMDLRGNIVYSGFQYLDADGKCRINDVKGQIPAGVYQMTATIQGQRISSTMILK